MIASAPASRACLPSQVAELGSGAHQARERIAVEIRQADVDDRDVRQALERELQAFARGLRPDHLGAQAAHRRRERRVDVVVVVDDEDDRRPPAAPARAGHASSRRPSR